MIMPFLASAALDHLISMLDRILRSNVSKKMRFVFLLTIEIFRVHMPSQNRVV
jgi:hypothetical protein